MFGQVGRAVWLEMGAGVPVTERRPLQLIRRLKKGRRGKDSENANWWASGTDCGRDRGMRGEGYGEPEQINWFEVEDVKSLG